VCHVGCFTRGPRVTITAPVDRVPARTDADARTVSRTSPGRGTRRTSSSPAATGVVAALADVPAHLPATARAAAAPTDDAPAGSPATAEAAVAPADDAALDACKNAYHQHRAAEVASTCGQAFASGLPSADVAIMLAKTEFERGRPRPAFDWATKAIALDANRADAYVFLVAPNKPSATGQPPKPPTNATYNFRPTADTPPTCAPFSGRCSGYVVDAARSVDTSGLQRYPVRVRAQLARTQGTQFLVLLAGALSPADSTMEFGQGQPAGWRHGHGPAVNLSGQVARLGRAAKLGVASCEIDGQFPGSGAAAAKRVGSG